MGGRTAGEGMGGPAEAEGMGGRTQGDAMRGAADAMRGAADADVMRGAVDADVMRGPTVADGFGDLVALAADAFAPAVARRLGDRIRVLQGMAAPGERRVGVLRERLMRTAYGKLRCAELAAAWVEDVPDIDLRMALALQSWQEFNHRRLLSERLGEMSADLSGYQPSPERRALYDEAAAPPHWLQRMAYLQLGVQGAAAAEGEGIRDLARALGDRRTSSLFEDQIRPDERLYPEIGLKALTRYATTRELRGAVVEALDRFLGVWDALVRGCGPTVPPLPPGPPGA